MNKFWIFMCVLCFSDLAAANQDLLYTESVFRYEIIGPKNLVCTGFKSNGVGITANHCIKGSQEFINVSPDVDISFTPLVPENMKNLSVCITPPLINERVMLFGYPGWAINRLRITYGNIISVDGDGILTDIVAYTGESGGPLLSIERQCVYGVLKGLLMRKYTYTAVSVFTPLYHWTEQLKPVH